MTFQCDLRTVKNRTLGVRRKQADISDLAAELLRTGFASGDLLEGGKEITLCLSVLWITSSKVQILRLLILQN